MKPSKLMVFLVVVSIFCLPLYSQAGIKAYFFPDYQEALAECQSALLEKTDLTTNHYSLKKELDPRTGPGYALLPLQEFFPIDVYKKLYRSLPRRKSYSAKWRDYTVEPNESNAEYSTPNFIDGQNTGDQTLSTKDQKTAFDIVKTFNPLVQNISELLNSSLVDGEVPVRLGEMTFQKDTTAAGWHRDSGRYFTVFITFLGDGTLINESLNDSNDYQLAQHPLPLVFLDNATLQAGRGELVVLSTKERAHLLNTILNKTTDMKAFATPHSGPSKFKGRMTLLLNYDPVNR